MSEGSSSCDGRWRGIRSSPPESLGGQTGPFRQSGELQPRDAGVRIVETHGGGGKPAIGARDDVFAADEIGVPLDPFGDQLRVLHQVGGVTDDAGDEDLALGQLDVLEDVVFVLVPRVGRFERIRAGIDLQDVTGEYWADRRTLSSARLGSARGNVHATHGAEVSALASRGEDQ